MTCASKRGARGVLDARRLALWAVAAVLLSAGCSDDSTGDGKPPSVHVAFPPPTSLTDAATIAIRGTVSDPDGVAAVHVNGAEAQLLADGTTWQATVSLEHGANSIVIVSEDRLGFQDIEAARLTVVLSANWMTVPRAVAADPANGRALVMDTVMDAVLAVDIATGERTILSGGERGSEVGSGPEFSDSVAVVVDEAGGRVLVLDAGLDALLAVDLDSGDRRVISNEVTGQGTAFAKPVAMALDIEGGRALIVDEDLAALFGVDLETGDRTVIASDSIGAGPALVAPNAVAMDVAGQRALVLDMDDSTPGSRVTTLYAVDLQSGERTVISDGSAGGPDFEDPTGMVLDATGEAPRALVVDDGIDGVLAVDLATGTRTEVSVDGTAPGQQLSVPRALALYDDGSGAQVLVADSGHDALVGIDLATGARSVVSGAFFGEGSTMSEPVAAVLDAPGSELGRALLVDRGKGACLEVDLATASRTVITDERTGSGPDLSLPQAVSLDVPVGPDGQVAPASRALVTDPARGALLGVELGTGTRVIISDASTGNGPAFGAPSAVALLPGDAVQGTSDSAIIADATQGAVYSVDLGTGDRTLITGTGTGSGPSLEGPVSVAIERDSELGAPSGRVLVGDEDAGAVMAVNLATGARTVIADAGTGNGPDLDAPAGIALELAAETVEQDGTQLVRYLPTGRALVADSGLGAIMAVDLATGSRSEISGPDTGRGPALIQPVSISVKPADGWALVTDEGLDALLVVDVQTGERVVVAR